MRILTAMCRWFIYCLCLPGAWLISGCQKKTIEDCPGNNLPAVLHILEETGDTILITDTAFAGHRIYFQTDPVYSSITWKIGDDPRVFNQASFFLFFNSTGNSTVSLTANETTSCGAFSRKGQQELTIVPANGSVISPLTGSYRGYITSRPNDVFDVAIKFWKAPKYSWAPDGFYYIYNLPKGYNDTTREINGVRCPELSGIECFPGYHHMAYDSYGNILTQGLKGIASIHRGLPDTLQLHFSVYDTALYRQTGQKVYEQQTYIGIKY